MTTTICRMPKARKHLDPRSRRYEIRFAIQFREMIDARGIRAVELPAKLRREGVDVTLEAVKKWLRGERLPHPADAEALGRVLGLKDYRKLWPPPMK